MCDTCTTHLLGPGEVAGKVARSKAGRKVRNVLFYVIVWTLGILMIPAIIVYTLGWWLLPIALGLVGLAAGVLLAVRRMQHLAVVTRPELTHEMRAKLAARNLRPIPAPAQAALPRGLAITRKRRALPAPAKALPGAEAVTGTVVQAPVKRPAR